MKNFILFILILLIISINVSSEEIILQDFEEGNGTKEFDIYAWDVWESAPDLDTSKFYKGKRSVKTNGHTVGINLMQREYDFTKFKKIFVYVLDTEGDNSVELRINDSSGKSFAIWSKMNAKKNEWSRISWDVKDFEGKVDLTKVRNVEFYEYSPGKYYFDNVGAEDDKIITKSSSAVTAEISSNALILQDFEKNNGTEEFDMYAWDAWESSPEIESNITHKGKRSLKTKGHTVGINLVKREFDISKYDSFFVYVLDKTGNNKVELRLKDMNEKNFPLWSNNRAQQNVWTKIIWNIDDFRGKVDLTKIKNVELYEYYVGEYYFDNVGVEGTIQQKVLPVKKAEVKIEVPAGGIADSEDDILLLQDFEEDNGTEDFDIYAWDAWEGEPEVYSGKSFKGKRSLKTKGHTSGINFMKREYDLTGYKRIFIYVFDTTGDNTAELRIKDMNDKDHAVWSKDKANKNKWTKISWNLNDFKDKIDLSRVRNIEIYEWGKGTYYFDNAGAEKTMLIQDFEDNNGTEKYFPDSAGSDCIIQDSVKLGGERALHLTGKNISINFNRPYYDLTGYSEIFLYVLDMNGDNNVKFLVSDMYGRAFPVKINRKTEKNKWTRIGCSLDKFDKKIDLTKVTNLEIYLTFKTECYIDNAGIK